MKFFEKRGVAITVLILAILLAAGIGWLRGPGSYAEQFIWDEAGVLSAADQGRLADYNKSWDDRYHSVVAFVSVNSASGDLTDYAYDLAKNCGLGESDALLLVVDSAGEYRLVFGGDFETLLNDSAMSRLDARMGAGDWLGFYSVMDGIYVEYFNGDLYSVGMGRAGMVILAVAVIVILLLILSAIDRSRYDTYRSRYYGVAHPPVVFRPILFWHGPTSRWYRRNWRKPAPPPPPPPRGPGSGPRPPHGGGFSGGSRSGSFSSGSRGSGFSGGSRSGSFSSGSRGSGFSGGSRSGGFSSGSRGGGFSGGSRGGGFSGGSRGGGFGRK